MKVNEQQRKRIDIDQRGNPIMTVRTIKYFCYKDLLYDTPQLNEKLYLHYKGFRKIQSLQHYPNLVTIWLSNNCISKIEGLNSLSNLICLYLNSNNITKIQNLEGLEKLSILHLAHNKIDKIQGLKCLKSLNFLNISQNFLNTPQSIMGLKQSESLTGIDLSKNQLENSNQLFNVISSLSKISCLTMKNTPISKLFKNYRKKLVAALKQLKYLDDRPIKQIDHRLAQAWVKGGPQLQNEQRIKIANEIEQKNRRENSEMSQRVAREKKRYMQIDQLQKYKKLIQEQIEDEQKAQQLKQIKKKLQVLKNGPKGFQASITNTSIKILNVKQQQEQQIINKYFSSQKNKVQQNLRKIGKEQLGIVQINLQSDEHLIQAKVCKILDLKAENDKEQYLQRWSDKYANILQALLIKYKYNFDQIVPQFNRIMADVNKKMFRVNKKFSQKQLQSIWTGIEIQRRQHRNH